MTTSCTNEKIDTPAGDAQVTFAVDLDGGMNTRAAADEFNADKLVYALYDAEGTLVAEIPGAVDGMVAKTDAFGADMTANVSLTLVKGQTYTVVFWAQNSACKSYTLAAEANGFNVDVDYTGANNDETRDAFFASETFTVEGNAEVGVILKRPFAQINLGVTEEDWNAAVASGINITESKVSIKNAATSINLLDGTVSGETDVNYGYAAIPSVSTKAATNVKDLQVNDASYKWLSMSYILTDESKTLSDAVQFTLGTDSGEEIVLSEGLNNVPVQRNWRTNVLGAVLTSNVDFTVYVDPIYYSTATIPAGDVAAFKAALADRNITVIKLSYGEYDGVFVHNTVKKTITSVDPAQKAVIKGQIGVSAPVDFVNLAFAPSANSLVKTGHKYLDKFERRSIVPIYAAKATFYGCDFTGLYDTDQVVAMNYGAHKKGAMLEVDNCTFQGYAYTIYSRALISVTNCTFDQYHTTVAPRAIFLYGLGDGSQGNVVFTGNKAVNKTSYAVQMSSSNYDYKNIHFNVQGNVNFDGGQGTSETDVKGPYLPHPDRDFTGKTFETGSAEF